MHSRWLMNTSGGDKPIVNSYAAIYQLKSLMIFVTWGSSPTPGRKLILSDSLHPPSPWLSCSFLDSSHAWYFQTTASAPFSSQLTGTQSLCSPHPNHMPPSKPTSSCSKQLTDSAGQAITFLFFWLLELITTTHLESLTFSLSYWSKYDIWPIILIL